MGKVLMNLQTMKDMEMHSLALYQILCVYIMASHLVFFMGLLVVQKSGSLILGLLLLWVILFHFDMIVFDLSLCFIIFLKERMDGEVSE